MYRKLTLTSSFVATALLAACSATPPEGDDDDDDDNGSGGSAASTQGGNSGTGAGTAGVGGIGGAAATGGGAGSGTAATGGTAGSGTSAGGAAGTGTGTGGASGSGTAAAAGTSGTGPATCSNASKATLPIDATGWVARECNERGIQGPWYCYTDNINPSDCVKDVVPYKAGMGACISGSTTLDDTFAAWGGGVALGLNETGKGTDGSASVKSAYNATMNGVKGFHIVVAGDTATLPLRVQFTNAAAAVGAMPFVQVPGPGAYDVTIADALVPDEWEGEPNAGLAADPASVYDMQVQVVGATAAANYNFCLTEVTPITDGSTPVGTVMNYGSVQCDLNAEIGLGNSYTVRNNVYNPMGGSECIQALWDNGSKAGFTISNVNLNVPQGNAPGSYPSVVLGWHYAKWHGSYKSAKALSAVTSVPTSWNWTVPPAGNYNVSYDVWLHASNANPPDPKGTLELMVWLNKRDATPIGTVGPTVTIGGQSWVVWYGPNTGGWNTVSYVAATNLSSFTGDLKPFFADSVTRGYISNSGYLLGVQGGFEVWSMTQNMTTNSFSVAIN